MRRCYDAQVTLQNHPKPRVGVPWRTAQEESEQNWGKLRNYLAAVREAGGEPVPVSLKLSQDQLAATAKTLDALVLPGSPADVEPSRYGATRHPKAAEADKDRERTDIALLDDAFSNGKPVLAICYGVQLLNVYLGGTLIQDIHSTIETNIRHSKSDAPPSASDPIHNVRLEAGSRVAALAGVAERSVNSSHHQSIANPAPKLRVTAKSADGIVEAVEWDGGPSWVVGVQWHPERMFASPQPGDAAEERDEFSRRLFFDLMGAARGAAVSRS